MKIEKPPKSEKECKYYRNNGACKICGICTFPIEKKCRLENVKDDDYKSNNDNFATDRAR